MRNLAALMQDTRWAERRVPSALQIGVITFSLLALELALIRWTTSQVRIFAYFNNVVLIGAFLGLGLGVALGRRRPGLVHAALPLLLLVAVPLALSEQLGLVHLAFPDNTILLFGGEILELNGLIFARNLGIFAAIWTAIVAVFLCGGAALGHLFSRLPVLNAYTADLAGSLLGIAAFTACAWANAGPAVWFALGALPLAWLCRTWWAYGAAVAVIALGQYSVRDAVYSPYNRIVLSAPGPLYRELEVNRDFHQVLHNLSDGRITDPALTAERRDRLQQFRRFYDLPFTINSRRGTALIVGACGDPPKSGPLVMLVCSPKRSPVHERQKTHDGTEDPHFAGGRPSSSGPTTARSSSPRNSSAG